MHERFLSLLQVLLDPVGQSIEVDLDGGVGRVLDADLLVVNGRPEVLDRAFRGDVDDRTNASVQDGRRRLQTGYVEILDHFGNAHHDRSSRFRGQLQLDDSSRTDKHTHTHTSDR